RVHTEFVSELLRRSTAILPLALSGAALVTIAVHIAFAGTAPQADEGTAAHIWQLLIVLEVCRRSLRCTLAAKSAAACDVGIGATWCWHRRRDGACRGPGVVGTW